MAAERVERKEGDPGIMKNDEQERRDDELRAERVVALQAPNGAVVYTTATNAPEMLKSGTEEGEGVYKEVRRMRRDNEPGQEPPTLPYAPTPMKKKTSGVQTGDLRATVAPGERINVSAAREGAETPRQRQDPFSGTGDAEEAAKRQAQNEAGGDQ
jgi:hypothetical protein